MISLCIIETWKEIKKKCQIDKHLSLVFGFIAVVKIYSEFRSLSKAENFALESQSSSKFGGGAKEIPNEFGGAIPGD